MLPLLRARGEELLSLYRRADAVRRQFCGEAVPVRAILEFSNHCANDCLYCGIRASNPRPARYRMSTDEILAAARQIAEAGLAGTIVLQAGETPGTADAEIEDLLRRIKSECPGLAITLSLGNRPRDVLARWRKAGMDRYLLRFETSDAREFGRLHPACTLAERLQSLRDLKDLGVQTGSGFMIGLPGERLETLADNIRLCRELDLDMIGIGPFIPHPDTPLGDQPNAWADDPDMFFRAIAVLRLVNPDAHIPATTAFDALRPDGRNLALQRGANVIMPDFTPEPYRSQYQIYPGKSSAATTDAGQGIERLIRQLGRTVGIGPGGRQSRS